MRTRLTLVVAGAILVLAGAAIIAGPDRRTVEPNVNADTVRAVEVLRIGSVDGPDALTAPNRALIAPDQTLYVHFAQDLNVRAFSPEGTPGPTWGGPGEGPGELKGVAWHMSMVGSRLYLGRIERLNWFDLDSGDLDTSIPYAAARETTSDPTLFPWSVLADGSIVFAPGPLSVGSVKGAETTAPVAVLRNTPSPRLDTILHQVFRHPRMSVREPGSTGGGYSVIGNPWDTSDLVEPHPALSAIVHIDRAPMGDEEGVPVRLVGPDGSVLAERRVAMPTPGELTGAERTRVIDHLVAELASRGRAPPASDLRRWIAASLDDDPVKPHVTDLVPTSDGFVWLQTPGSPVLFRTLVTYGSPLWLVLDSGLNPVRWVRLPDGFRLLDARGDVAWGAVTDDLDVPYLVKLRLAG